MAVRPDAGAGSPSSLGAFSPPGDWGAGSPSSLGGADAPLGDDTGAGSPYSVVFEPIVAVATSTTTIEVVFNEDVDPTNTIDQWSISPVGLAAGVVIIAMEIDGPVVTLTVYEAMTPGGEYQVSGVGIESTGTARWTGDELFTVSASFIGEARPDIGLLRGLLSAIGGQLNALKGVPRTRLAIDWTPGDAIAFGVTALRFPSAGAVFIGQYRFTYVGRTSTALLAVQPDLQSIGETLVAGTPVMLDDRYWLPSDLLALPNVRDYLDPWYVQEAIAAESRGRIQ